MKSYILILAILSISSCASIQSPKETNIAVSALLDEIQIAINIINTQTKCGKETPKNECSSLPPFKNAEVVISTKASSSNEASASLILTAQGKKSTTHSNVLTLTLVPNERKPDKGITPTTGQQLANYVIEAVKAIDNKNYLALQKLVVEAGFTVTIDTTGGIEIELGSVAIGGKYSDTSNDGHKLKLVFEKTPKKKPSAGKKPKKKPSTTKT